MENKDCIPMTFVSLKEYFDARFLAMEKQTELTRSVLERNTELTRLNLEGRLASMNEFRASLTDQAASFVPRKEHDILADKLDKLESKIDLQAAIYIRREDIVTMLDGYEKRIRPLEESKVAIAAVAESKASQMSVWISTSLGILGLFAGIASLILRAMGK